MPKRALPRRLRFMTEPTGGDPAGGGAPAATSQPSAAAGSGDPNPGEQNGDGGQNGQSSDDDEPLGPGGKKALDSERDARKQAEKDLAELRKQIEDSKKTAEQKAADDLKAARDAAANSALQALKYEVAAEKELPLKFASRLTGATKEELLADAEELKEFIGEQRPNGPRPNPLQGKSGTPALPESQPGVPRMAAAFEQAIESRA